MTFSSNDQHSDHVEAITVALIDVYGDRAHFIALRQFQVAGEDTKKTWSAVLEQLERQ